MDRILVINHNKKELSISTIKRLEEIKTQLSIVKDGKYIWNDICEILVGIGYDCNITLPLSILAETLRR